MTSLSQSHPCTAPAPFRRGHVLSKLLVIIALCAAIWAGKQFILPESLQARFQAAPPSTDNPANQREFLNTLGRLIDQSYKVLAVHNRGETPYNEIVLWREDTTNPGVIDPAEVAVISHSQVMRAITVYAMNAGDDAPGGSSTKAKGRTVASHPRRVPPPGQVLSSRAQPVTDGPLTPALLSQTSFCDRWRASPQVKAQVIATGISDLEVEMLGPEGDELSLLRLTLRWGGNSADGAQEASVLVNREDDEAKVTGAHP